MGSNVAGELEHIVGDRVPPHDLEAEQATLAAALDYAARGWAVLPVEPRGKRPLKAWGRGVHDATTDPEIVGEWWARWPEANVGVAIPEGFIVVDLDGLTGRASVAGRHLAATVTCETARGWHYWYQLPEDGTAANRSGLLPGIDLRAAGGYVVAPPSVHPTGALYAWATGLGPGEVEIAPGPAWLIRLLCKRRRPAHAPTHQDTPGAEPQGGEIIPEGRRNSTLYAHGRKLRDVGFRLPELRDALLAMNARCAPPLTEGEVRAIARSAAGAPAGKVRVDRRIVSGRLSDGATLAGALLAAGITEKEIATTAAVSERTVARWLAELRRAGLEAISRTRPTRRFVEVPRCALLDRSLSTAAKVTLLHLATYVRDGRAQVGQEQLAKRRGRVRHRVTTDLHAARAAGYVLFGACRFDADLGRRAAPNSYTWAPSEIAERDTDMPREVLAEAR